MSKIQELLQAATEVEPSKRKNETATSQDYMKRLAVAVGELSEDEWKKLPVEAQDWYNSAADAIEAKKEIPGYPDEAKAETTTRRRGGSEAKAEPYKPKKGDQVNITTKRGKAFTGVTIADVDGDVIVLDDDTELALDKIETIEQVGGGKASAASDEPKDPGVGDTVEVVTARGKTIVGNVVEMDDDSMVLKDTTGEEHELLKEKLKSVKVKVDNSSAAASDKPATKTSAKSEPAAADGDKKKITRADNGGVSATQRMRELICANLEAKKDDVAANLKKEGLEFKQSTLDLVYADSHKLIGILRDLKKLK